MTWRGPAQRGRWQEPQKDEETEGEDEEQEERRGDGERWQRGREEVGGWRGERVTERKASVMWCWIKQQQSTHRLLAKAEINHTDNDRPTTDCHHGAIAAAPQASGGKFTSVSHWWDTPCSPLYLLSLFIYRTQETLFLLISVVFHGAIFKAV